MRVLERLGHTVEFPPAQTCCGQMHYNTGYRREALPLLQRFVDSFRDAEAVVVPSSSCVAMMRDHYPAMARAGRRTHPELRPRSTRLLPRVFEFSELLVDKLGVTDVGAYFPHRVTYHASCHGLRVSAPRRRAASAAACSARHRSVELPELEQCCGFGGTFAVKNADVSSAMLAEKIACGARTRAPRSARPATTPA